MPNVALQPLDGSDLDDRGPPRYRLLTTATARGSGATDLSVTLHNLSTTGLLIHAATRLAIGSTVLVELSDTGEVEARIVWTSGGFHGAEFSRPLTDGAVRAHLAVSKVVWPDFATRSPPGRTARDQAPIRMDDASVAEAGDVAHGDELPLARRIQIMLAASMLLWVGVIQAVKALVG